ncbi:MAG: hypothetical protein Q9161_004428 [Pseudevernia consocians]
MVTSTVYSDSQIVVVDVGSVPATVPWLEQTTYLIDESGHTTAVLAQTDQPTSGVTLAPVPYTTQAQIALPSATAGSLPSGWAYKGCYIDYYPSARVLPMQYPDNSNLTIQSCVWSCYQLGYSISGLEHRMQCFCGNNLYNNGTLAPSDSDCDLPCTGDAKEVCGAHNRLSIYSSGTVTTYQPVAVQTSRPSPTKANSRTPKPTVIVAAAVIGLVGGIAITVALVYLRLRIRSNRLRTKSLLQTSQVPSQAWPPAEPVPSWEEFLKETEGYYARFDESTTHSNEGNGFGLGLKSIQVGHRPSVPELRERYEQLHSNKQQTSHARSGSSDTYVASPARFSPSARARTQTNFGPPTSILKHPAPTGIANMAQNTFELEERQDSRGVPTSRNLALAKKGVRFGVNQIREFGRSPFIGRGSDC